MKDSGKMINAMEMDLIIMLMVQTIVDSGNKIYKTVMEFKNLIMVTFTKGKYLIINRQHKYGKKHGQGKFLWSDGSIY